MPMQCRTADDAPRVAQRRTIRIQVRPHGDDIFAFHQPVGLWEIAHDRNHRKHGATANNIAPPRPAVGCEASRLNPAAAIPVAA